MKRGQYLAIRSFVFALIVYLTVKLCMFVTTLSADKFSEYALGNFMIYLVIFPLIMYGMYHINNTIKRAFFATK
jgi:hypothetical protein